MALTAAWFEAEDAALRSFGEIWRTRLREMQEQDGSLRETSEQGHGGNVDPRSTPVIKRGCPWVHWGISTFEGKRRPTHDWG